MIMTKGRAPVSYVCDLMTPVLCIMLLALACLLLLCATWLRAH
jgi:hypothetical protein